MAHKTCIYCGRNNIKSTNEHAPATWIATEFGDGSWTVLDLTRDRAYRTVGNLGVTLNDVCEECNRGWMNDLEGAVRPILVPLMNGITSALTPEQQLVIVRWFAKTVITYELTAGHPPHFEANERRSLMDDLTVPGRSLFFLGRYGGSRPIEAREVMFTLFHGPQPDNVIPVDAYCATFLIKQVVLQVLRIRIPKDVFGHNISIARPASWDDDGIKIWPIDGIATWPPTNILDDEGFENFAYRWNNL